MEITVTRSKLLWATWDLRVVVLFSLVLQIFLIFCAPLRKRVSTAWITMPLWCAYLLADAVATYGVALISKGQCDATGPFSNRTLLAFWAPFLLVHLGGPDTITAFALEDNELWLRHLLSLVSHGLAAAYAFSQSFPNHKFWLPTLLMFVSGIIKYTERTRAFYLASSRKFKASLVAKPDPGPNYAKLMDEMKKPNTRLPKKIEWAPESTRVNRSRTKEERAELDDLKVVQVAHQYFSVFNGLIADSIFSFRERNLTRDFFLNRKARDAFKVVEVELNFFYEILYTKAAVVHGILGYLPRILSFCLTFATIVIFYLIDKKKIDKIDVGVSYSLLLGAIALDLTAFVMVLYSDWTVVAVTKSAHVPNRFMKILRKLLRVERERWPETPGKNWIMERRWSESISKFNLVNCCLHPRAKWLEATAAFFGITNILDEMAYVKKVKFTDDLRDHIFKELKRKSELADNLEMAKEIFSAKGNWILQHENQKNLLRWINEVDFDESLVLWHVATDLCYYTNEDKANANDGDADKNDVTDYCEISKLLSDYMLYLLIIQSTMLSDVAGIGQTRFSDTCAEAKRLFGEKDVGKSEEDKTCCGCLNMSNFGKCFCGTEPHCYSYKCRSKREKDQEKDQYEYEFQKKACESILAVDILIEPFAVKRYRSKSVLFDACMLAKELKTLKRPKRWEIISKVWVELLCYAACHCRGNNHVAQLSKGGQLLTLVWLLMAHLGLSDHFQIRDGHASAKLIMKKQVVFNGPMNRGPCLPVTHK